MTVVDLDQKLSVLPPSQLSGVERHYAGEFSAVIGAGFQAPARSSLKEPRPGQFETHTVFFPLLARTAPITQQSFARPDGFRGGRRGRDRWSLSRFGGWRRLWVGRGF